MFGKLAAGAATVVLTTGLTICATTGVGADTQSGDIHFTLTQDSSSPNPTVIIRGAFTDSGTSVSKSQYDRAKLSKGSFFINHPDSAATFKFHADPDTCYYTIKITGAYTITGRTQAYKNLTGSGTYVGKGQGIAARKADGTCNTNSEPVSSTFTVTGHGPVSFGSDEG